MQRSQLHKLSLYQADGGTRAGLKLRQKLDSGKSACFNNITLTETSEYRLKSECQIIENSDISDHFLL